ISIPIWLRNAFGGRKTLVRSLNTSDLRVARRKRDVIADEFHHIRQIAEPPKPDSLQDTISYLKSVAKYAKAAPKASAPIISQCPSLNKMLEIYLTHNADRLKIGTLSKTRKAVELFLNYLRKKDVELNDINRTTVTGWLDHLRETKAVQTVANYLSAMANILDLASSRYQDAPPLESNVFRGHKLNTAQSRQSYEAFTDEEITKLISTFNKLGEDELRDLSAIAAYSGMRINEIASLKSDNIREVEGVLCFDVLEGKTANASRLIPCHSAIKTMVLERCQKPHNGFLFYRASVTKREDGKRSSWHVNRFGRLKRDILPGQENKVFHSYRHAVI
ncbi:phage integrase SAM-like domain-containing protein, partial [Cronobacter sakazakii]|uniref:phage integrase SAM-like domain-containing protein n=2 Tax=Enterobacterales TaxID=91347 RepID=UPI001178828B